MYCPNRNCIDFELDGIHGEYVETMTACPKCGAALVAALPDDDQPSRDAVEEGEVDSLDEQEEVPAPRGPLVALAAFDRPEEAHALSELLAANGIEAYEFYDDGRDFEDPGDVSPCTRVLVPASQAAAAAPLAERLDR